MNWSVFDFVLAATLLAAAGLLLTLGLRRPRSIAPPVAAGLLGVAAAVVGEADDAPGLVLFGGLLVVAGVAIAARGARLRGSGTRAG